MIRLFNTVVILAKARVMNFQAFFLLFFVLEPNFIVSVRDSSNNAAKAVAGSVGGQIT